MAGGGADTMLAYYMFVNHGWNPKRVAELSEREQALMLDMALKEIRSRPRKE